MFWLKTMEEKDIEYTEIDTKNSIAVFRLLMAIHNPLNLNGDSTELYNKIRKEYNDK